MARKQTLTDKLMNEVLAFACDAGVVLITRAEMYRFEIMDGSTRQQADFAAFAMPAFDGNDACPLVSNDPITANEAYALVYADDISLAA